MTPRTAPFTAAFAGLAAEVHQGTLVLRDTLGVTTVARGPELDRVRALLREAEQARGQIVAMARESFITPFDRGDIHQLAVALSDVLVHLERAVDAGIRYRLDDAPDSAATLIDTLVRMAELTAETMPELHDLGAVVGYPAEMRRLGMRADQTRRDMLSDTLSGRSEPLRAVRVTLVIEEVALAVRGLERAATVVEGIVIKES
ncbi:DUF47 domain-containing protein [Ornithinimicrobium cavernae]|uniref:DUF47 domain-containing protein n=1 Tax=Ornithinimicrobium cavernae TaxID=2666047 RepID=UPI001379CF7C|nr:DUF47 family protein [Ornithinimicrobium cavernae]